MSVLIVFSLALGGLLASVIVLSPTARAAACDQVAGVPTGDWVVSTVQVCSGFFTVDGTININSGGSLTVRDGGLNFSKDATPPHASYALNVNAGGELILDHSTLTTVTKAINPYLKLAVTVSGAGSRFAMEDGSMIKFPGWFNATAGATLNISKSTVTGFVDSDLSGLGVDTDDNNDAPSISWASTSASVFASRFERLYEYTSGPNGTGSMDFSLTASTSLYAYDTYLGVDFKNVAGWHNTLSVDGTSNAYLYNVTVDRSQDPPLLSDFQPAYVPTAAGGSVYLLRWAHVVARDSTNFPMSGTTIASTLSPSSAAAQYPDNGAGATTPTTRTIWYLGRTSSGTNAWDRTDSSGTAAIPLFTDQITTASLPNAESFGNYEELATYSASTQTGSVSFPPYPAIDAADNNVWLTLSFSGVSVRTGPDLVLQATPSTMTVIQNQPFTVYALISNSGQTDATNAAVAAYANGNPANEVARATGVNVAAGAVVNRSLTVVAGMPIAGPATLELIVDPNNLINEGGAAQESNNFANITLNVVLPPSGSASILSPSSGQSFEPGKPLAVTGYLRDTNSNGIEGVPVIIELRSGTTVLSTNTTTSGGQGFFIGTITVPSGTQDGSYSIVATPSASSISSGSVTIAVKTPGSILNQIVPIIGIPFWLLFIMIAAVVAVAIGVTMYWKVYGLGKMVECGECGAFIAEDATTCPKCGVEFEKDMAKCSNCQAWIPVDVKQCPECGVEFATGELEMADYQQKMRLQYDEVVGRFKEEGSRQLGRSLSESEFQEWWRKQPTFLTYEDWLREEEEMRKMGSRPCPTCGTLNSVTARVCHKCGSLMRDQRPPSGGGGAVVAAAPRRPSAPGPGTSEGQGPQAAPYGAPPGTPPATTGRRLFQKSAGAPPVVQKRVVKKPLGEGQEGTEGAESQSGSEKSEEDL